jgi:hypothetical protein
MAEEKTGEQIMKEKFSPIFMRYVPKEVATQFRKFAAENSAGHYGTALKMLLDNLKWAEQLNDLSVRVASLETKPAVPVVEKKVPKTIGGK